MFELFHVGPYRSTQFGGGMISLRFEYPGLFVYFFASPDQAMPFSVKLYVVLLSISLGDMKVSEERRKHMRALASGAYHYNH